MFHIFCFTTAKSVTSECAGETRGATKGSDAALTRLLCDGRRAPFEKTIQL